MVSLIVIRIALVIDPQFGQGGAGSGERFENSGKAVPHSLQAVRELTSSFIAASPVVGSFSVLLLHALRSSQEVGAKKTCTDLLTTRREMVSIKDSRPLCFPPLFLSRGKVVLPTELIDALDNIRLLGNDAAHVESQDYAQIGREEVEIAVEFTKEVLKAVYQYTGLLKRLNRLKKSNP